jgi:type III secretion protein J
MSVLAMVALLGCRSQIQHGLDESEANELQTVLLERGFDARKVREGGKKPSWALEVPDEQGTSAVRALAELGLPRPRSEGMRGLKKGLVPTPTEERAAYVAALSEEVARTLETLSGVTLARVHLVAPPPPRPGQAQGTSRAAVLLRVRPGHGERISQAKDELRALVAQTVEGLSAEEVAIVVDEIVSGVSAPPRDNPLSRLRLLSIVLATAVCLLATGLAFLALQLRRRPAHQPHAPAPRAVINPALLKRAA